MVKNCDGFSHCVKRYIQEEHKDRVILVTGQVVFFSDTHDCVNAQHSLKTNSLQNISLEEPDHSDLCFVDMFIEYVDGHPPLLVCAIHCKPRCFLELCSSSMDFKNLTNSLCVNFICQVFCDIKLFYIMNKFCFIELCPAISQRTTSMSRASSKNQGGIQHKNYFEGISMLHTCITCRCVFFICGCS